MSSYQLCSKLIEDFLDWTEDEEVWDPAYQNTLFVEYVTSRTLLALQIGGRRTFYGQPRSVWRERGRGGDKARSGILLPLVLIDILWNLSNLDTLGTEESVLISEVS